MGPRHLAPCRALLRAGNGAVAVLHAPDPPRGVPSGLTRGPQAPHPKTKTPPRRTAFSKSIDCQRLSARHRSGRTAGLAGTCRRCWGGQTAFALQTLTGQLAGATNGLGLLASLLFRGLLVVVAQLHLAEDAFALQLFLERAQRLVNVVIANDYLQRSTALSKLGHVGWMIAPEPKNTVADQQSQSPWAAL